MRTRQQPCHHTMRRFMRTRQQPCHNATANQEGWLAMSSLPLLCMPQLIHSAPCGQKPVVGQLGNWKPPWASCQRRRPPQVRFKLREQAKAGWLFERHPQGSFHKAAADGLLKGHRTGRASQKEEEARLCSFSIFQAERRRPASYHLSVLNSWQKKPLSLCNQCVHAVFIQH